MGGDWGNQVVLFKYLIQHLLLNIESRCYRGTTYLSFFNRQSQSADAKASCGRRHGHLVLCWQSREGKMDDVIQYEKNSYNKTVRQQR